MKTKQLWMTAAISGLSFFALSCGEKKEKITESMGDKVNSAASSMSSAVSTAVGGLTLEGAAEKMAGLMEENMDLMMTIKDEESLKAAEAKLDKLGDQLMANAEALKKLPKPDAATKQALADKMKKGMETKMGEKAKAMQEHMMKLATEKPELIMKITALQTKFAEKMTSISAEMNEYF